MCCCCCCCWLLVVGCWLLVVVVVVVVGSLIGMVISKLDTHFYQRGIMLILFLWCLIDVYIKPSRREYPQRSRNCDESFYPEDQSMQTIYNNVRYVWMICPYIWIQSDVYGGHILILVNEERNTSNVACPTIFCTRHWGFSSYDSRDQFLGSRNKLMS